MADLSESDYGLGDYGDGYYSLSPIWLFESAVSILVDADSDLAVSAFGGFEATVSISLDADSSLSVSDSFESAVSIQFDVRSIENFDVFWEGWIPITGGVGNWQPIGPDMRPNKPWSTL